MIKSKLAVIIDSLFISFIIFILLFFWVHKIIKNAFLSLFCSIFISLLAFFIIFKFLTKKFKLKNITFKEEKFEKECIYKLKYMESQSLINFYETLLNAKNVDKNMYKNDSTIFYISTKARLSEIDFNSAYDYYLLTSKTQNTDFVLCFIGSSVTNEFTNLLENSPVKFNLFSEHDLYIIMKDKNFYPENINPNTTPQKSKKFSTIKSKFSSSITRSHFKELFFSGISLILISIVIPFSSYYLIFGTILLILALVSLFIKNKSPTNSLNKNQTLLSLIKKDVTKK